MHKVMQRNREFKVAETTKILMHCFNTDWIFDPTGSEMILMLWSVEWKADLNQFLNLMLDGYKHTSRVHRIFSDVM